jgi:hypothetical protein
VWAESSAQPGAYPIRVHLEGPGIDHQLTLKGDGRQALELPADYAAPVLIRVTTMPSGTPEPGRRHFELRLDADQTAMRRTKAKAPTPAEEPE